MLLIFAIACADEPVACFTVKTADESAQIRVDGDAIGVFEPNAFGDFCFALDEQVVIEMRPVVLP